MQEKSCAADIQTDCAAAPARRCCVYPDTCGGGVAATRVLEVCEGWLETDAGILDFDDHGISWWLTKIVAEENV